MLTVLYIMLAASLGLAAARWLRVPGVPLLLVGGIGLKSTGLLPDEGLLRDALMLGLAFLVFFAGTELNPSRVGRQKRAACIVGLAQFLLIGVIGAGVVLLLGYELGTALYMGLALSASSTLVVVSLLRSRQQFFEPFGRLVLGVLLLQDILVVVALGGLSGVEGGLLGVGEGLGKTLVLIVMAVACQKWITPWLIVKLDLDEESLLLMVMAILFAFIGASVWLGLPLVVGAFLAGVSLSGFPSNGMVRGQLNSLADFFQAVFFVSLGASLVWLTPYEFALAALLTVMVIVLTPPLVIAVSRRIGLSSRVGTESGLLVAQCSEFSLIVVLLATAQGHIDERMFHIMAVVTVVTMVLTPFYATDRLTWQLMRLRLSRSPDRPTFGLSERPHDHILLLGCGSNGRHVLPRLKESGRRVLVVDDDPGIVDQLKREGVEAIRGDGADYMVLRDAGARQARVIISTMRRISDNERLLRFTWEANVPVLLRTFDAEAAEQLAILGALPVIESEIAADATLRWIDERLGAAKEPSTTT
ncbi:MAG: cation:proton antiporter [Phycisphaeraceae bacterium]|nr:cation:proton antiporter [Phycisphaeraceae bacterium]